MSSLSAWLERTNPRTGKVEQVFLSSESFTLGKNSQELPLSDPEVSEIHAIVTCDKHHFVIRDLGSATGTFVNNRKIVETALTNLDEIRIGRTLLTFRASFLTQSATQQHSTTSDKSAMSSIESAPTAYCWPQQALTNPVKYWTALDRSTLLSGKSALPIHLLNLVLFSLVCFGLLDHFSGIHLAFLVLASSLGFIATAVIATVFQAELSDALHFVFGVSPFLLLGHFVFLIVTHQMQLPPNQYFLLSTGPTLFFWGFVTLQSYYGLKFSLWRGLGFAISASVPWNLLMTGLLWFIF